MEEAPQSYIAVLPAPGMGHLIPLIELSRKLLDFHNFSVTFVIPDDGANTELQKGLLQSVPSVNSMFLPPAAAPDLPPDARIESRVMLSLSRFTPSLCAALTELKNSGRLTAILVDLFDSSTLDAFKGIGVPLYVFFSSSAMALSFTLHLPKLDESIAGEYADSPDPIVIPGCIPLRGSDLTDSVQDRSHPVYDMCLEFSKKLASVDGVLVNSFLELEPDTFKAFEKSAGPTVYPVGPLIRSGKSDENKADCLKWLDEQPAGSVIFVSFGSGGTLSTHQLNELALGLELSQQRFLFVAKRPDDKVRNAAYFDAGSKTATNDLDYLPSGFIDRTKGKGLVVSTWVPQTEILAHSSVGGFLTHCGWNSTLENVMNGVPLIVWPLFAEQRMNAVLLSEVLKVGFRVVEDENGVGVVGSEQVARLVRSLMEGEEGKELRDRMGILKEAGKRALSPEGSSMKSLADVAEKWKGGEINNVNEGWNR